MKIENKMKKTILFLVTVLVNSIFIGCSSDDEDNVGGKNFMEHLTEAQKKALLDLNGTFVYIHDAEITTITFKERYNPSRVFTINADYNTAEEGTERLIHGLLTTTYSDGTSLDRYYYLTKDVSTILLSATEKGLRTTFNIELISSTEFKLKESNDLQWEVYKKE